MQHRKSRLRLNLKPQHRRMVERNLVTSLFLYEKIRTTRKRAKVIQPIIDNLVTVAKTKTPQLAIRQINAFVTHENACRKLMEDLTKRLSNRTSGYTKLTAVGARKGDGAEVVDLTLLVNGDAPAAEAPVKKEKPKKTAAKKPAPAAA